jgi:hypothetical protein
MPGASSNSHGRVGVSVGTGAGIARNLTEMWTARAPAFHCNYGDSCDSRGLDGQQTLAALRSPRTSRPRPRQLSVAAMMSRVR